MSARRILAAAIVSGSVATATSTAALALLALAEGKGAAQPLNATSHWLHGERAAGFRHRDLDHTAVGFGTHYAATIFWASFFEAWLVRRPPHGGPSLVSRAAAVSALAALVDYTITPRRFTPGWELVLSKAAMAIVYGAMGAGFLGTALVRNGAVRPKP